MSDMRQASEKYSELVHRMAAFDRRMMRSWPVNLLVAAVFVAVFGAVIYTVGQVIMPADAQQVGGWRESLSGSSAGAMDPTGGNYGAEAPSYGRMLDRLDRALAPYSPEGRANLRSLERARGVEEIDRANRLGHGQDGPSGGQSRGVSSADRGGGNFGADGSNNK